MRFDEVKLKPNREGLEAAVQRADYAPRRHQISLFIRPYTVLPLFCSPLPWSLEVPFA